MAEIAHDIPDATFAAERAKAFVDAVVAIAMTLLILPLMESVSEVAVGGGTAADWVGDHVSSLISFALSFVIIAMLWMNHHQLFASVERISRPMLWLLVAWMASIVWLPVATALSGQMSDRDPVAKSLYIGSMIVTCLISLAIRAHLEAHPALHGSGHRMIRRGMAVDLAMACLFALSLLVSLLIPAVGYFALFLMMATGPVRGLFLRLLEPRSGGGAAA